MGPDASLKSEWGPQTHSLELHHPHPAPEFRACPQTILFEKKAIFTDILRV